jgi:hypothetical protein
VSEPKGEPDRFWSRPSWTGKDYQSVLRRFHEALKPSTYLEIGVEKGATLALAECASIAVDPDFPLVSPAMNNKPSCFFFRCTSDAFFRDNDPSRLFGRPIDLAFLDGLHHYEVLLRDFLHTEKHCRRGSIILMHDCLPRDSFVGRRRVGDRRYRERTAEPTHWAGDVWKTVAILKKARPDLKVVAYDAAPTGLVAITNLDANSTVLEARYFELVGDMAALDLYAGAEDYYSSLGVRNFDEQRQLSALSVEFWL